MARVVGPDRWMRASIASIIRGLFAAVAISATLAALFALVSLPEMAVPFFLATMIELGLIVVSVVWRALTRALPDPD